MAKKPQRAHVGSAPLPEHRPGEKRIRWTVYQVFRRPRGEWVGKVRGAHRASVVEHLKEKAVKRTCDIARHRGWSVVWIYLENTDVGETREYRRPDDD